MSAKDADKAKVERAQALVSMRESMPFLLEYAALEAKVTRGKFLALVSQGFTEQQAIELCKKP